MTSIPLPPLEVRKRNLVIVGLTAAGVYGADLITKILAVQKLENEDSVEIVGSLFQLDFTRNAGAAFGIGVGMTIVFTALSLVVIGVVLRTANRLGSTWWAVVFGLVLGGALGNLTDRLFRSPGFMRGEVVDFLHLKNWPVFNLADTAFCIAGGIVFLLVLRNIPLEGRRTS
jgi:signal peptidase II